jgi:hypothetical protein
MPALECRSRGSLAGTQATLTRNRGPNFRNTHHARRIDGKSRFSRLIMGLTIGMQGDKLLVLG